MDTMRGSFGSLVESDSYDLGEAEPGGKELASIAPDERRMQVRAYNHWASLLGERSLPSVEDLEPENLADLGPYSVLMDVTNGIENPGIVHLGANLARECDIDGNTQHKLSDVPARCVLTRITDHYMQILANQAPIGFEAECLNQRGEAIIYRGILMPFSSDDDTIDFIYGVINWQPLPEAQEADELLLEIGQALDGSAAGDTDNVLPMPSFGYAGEKVDEAFDLTAFELDEDDEPFAEDEGDEEDANAGSSFGSLLKMPLNIARPTEKAAVALPELDPAEMAVVDLQQIGPAPQIDPAQMGLDDWLAAARDRAMAARNSEDRTRGALYDAIGRAYDFSLAAADAPQAFAELLEAHQLTVQERAPLTPVVKLVFGADYDKTRVTEYAAALSHAHRLNLPLGGLGRFLSEHEGGLKGVVQAERRLRKEEAGKAAEPTNRIREALARKLRQCPAQAFSAIDPSGSEFALVMIRRSETGEVVMLGEVPEDVTLLERAARRLVG